MRGIIDSSTITGCSLIYNKLRILKPDNNELISKSGACTGTIIGPVTLPTGGIYTIVVDPYATYTGNVSLRVVSP